ncbi:hypothetical protein L1987_14073 [Smallanthus sonchifolius]|uniref:Uncharacterized protein n=1 Tax=Smallanthus sonchifolius TaxID=185202 RepID=A0ACB9J1T0_9ASTR|nr:hypothetical protein L1987_14073 [Smallanthus sonchifolius]
MARGGNRLTKLMSMLKKWQSLGKRSSSAIQDDNHWQAVYVGKSRRRYHISSQVAEHPVFQELVERSGDRDTVDCEVVLFEHLLWMLENADPQPLFRRSRRLVCYLDSHTNQISYFGGTAAGDIIGVRCVVCFRILI